MDFDGEVVASKIEIYMTVPGMKDQILVTFAEPVRIDKLMVNGRNALANDKPQKKSDHFDLHIEGVFPNRVKKAKKKSKK
jgi:hypothetical protein